MKTWTIVAVDTGLSNAITDWVLARTPKAAINRFFREHDETVVIIEVLEGTHESKHPDGWPTFHPKHKEY